MYEPVLGYDVVLKHAEGFRAAIVEHRGSYANIGSAFTRLARAVNKHGLRPAGPMVVLYYDDPNRTSTGELRSAAGVIVKGRPRTTEDFRIMDVEPTLVASTIHDGPPEEYPATYAKLNRWIVANGYEVAGLPRELDPRSMDEMARGRIFAEVQVPVRRPPRH